MSNYTINEAKIRFHNNEILMITVLVQISRNDLRIINATTSPKAGYIHIKPTDKLSFDLLQAVAASGYES